MSEQISKNLSYISVLIDGKKYELKNLKLINFYIENKFLYNNSINAYQSTSIQSSESKNFCVTFGGIFAKYTSKLEKSPRLHHLIQDMT